MQKRKIWLIAAGLFAILAAVAAVLLILGVFREKQATEQAEALAKSVTVTPPIQPEEAPQPSASPQPSKALQPTETPAEPEDAKPDIPVDFETLQQTNGDIYGWISIPDTDIDFPIVQSPDSNEYYLSHDIYGNESESAAIYTENYNTKDFTDFNTVIYGHNFRTGGMFSSLLNYRDREFFDDNPYIYIYTPDKILKYEIFASYVFDDRHLLADANFEPELARQMYIDYIFLDRSMSTNFNKNVSVTGSDSIITLSTCTFTNGERYLVQGVLVDVQQ